jgi:hypothetical protein
MQIIINTSWGIVKIIWIKLGVVVHSYNSNYSGGRDRKILILRPALTKVLWPYLKKKKTVLWLKCQSTCKHAWGPDPIPSTEKKLHKLTYVKCLTHNLHSINVNHHCHLHYVFFSIATWMPSPLWHTHTYNQPGLSPASLTPLIFELSLSSNVCLCPNQQTKASLASLLASSLLWSHLTSLSLSFNAKFDS